MLSDKQFLLGDAEAKAAEVLGELRVARGEGRLPVVVLIHGPGGIGPNVEMWSKEFNATGVSSFAIDGFTGRGLTQVSSNRALLGRLNFILDIYRGLDILAKHPRVDPQRIVLMGFSRGGQAALYASLKRFHTMWNKSGAEFAAYLPFYPDCATTFIGGGDVADKPIRIFGGTPDDYNPIALCKPYVARLKSRWPRCRIDRIPGRAARLRQSAWSANATAQSAVAERALRCEIAEEPAGILIDAASKQPFTYEDACVERVPHTGHDPDATRQATQSVTAFLRGVLKLP